MQLRPFRVRIKRVTVESVDITEQAFNALQALDSVVKRCANIQSKDIETSIQEASVYEVKGSKSKQVGIDGS